MIRRQGTTGPVVSPLQRALRFVRDLGLGRRRRAPAASAGTRRVVASRGASGHDLLSQLEREREECAQHIARLQAELDRLHDEITAGLSAAASPGSTRRDDLEQLVERSRAVRESIQEKRLDLVRLERNIARERLLRGETRRAKAEPPRAAPGGAGDPPGDLARRRVVGKALRDSKLGDAPEHRAVRRWALGLLDPNPATRREAVSRIAHGPHRALPLLQLAAEDSDPRVRLAAANGLSFGKGAGAADSLRRLRCDPSAAVRVAALRGLARLDPRLPSASEIEAALEDSEPAVRKAAVELCAPRRHDSGVPATSFSALSFALHDDDVSVRLAATQALRAAGDPRGAAALMRAVADSSPEVSAAAFDALSAIVPRAAEVAGAGLSPGERSRVLRTWWRDARVDDQSGGDAGGLAAAALEAALELARAESRRTPRPAESRAPAAPPPAAPSAVAAAAAGGTTPAEPTAAPARAPAPVAAPAAAPAVPGAELDAEPGADEFESILGDEESGAESAAAPDSEVAAEPKDDFESVFDEGAENGEDEEYEKILGEDKT